MEETSVIQWIVLAIVQGLTEYLPVSSSAHLVLTSKTLQWKDQGLFIDIAAHAGSLVAVSYYFRSEIIELLSGKNNTLLTQLIISAIPIAVVGFFIFDLVELYLRMPIIIALSSIVFGVLLYWSDKKIKHQDKQMSTKHAVIVGFTQVFALIPGASRSGITMTAAMTLGYSRKKAARFSFLLAIPVLCMTTAYALLKLATENHNIDIVGFIVVALLSFFTSLFCISVFLKWIEKISMSWFMWYRIGLGVLILVFLI